MTRRGRQQRLGAGRSARSGAARTIAATISLLLVAGLSPLPSAIAATDDPASATNARGAEPVTEAKDLAAARAAARAQGAPVESLAERSETATVRALPDGRLSAELFAAPIRYKDAEGTWRAVDVTLRQAPDGAIVPIGHPAALRFAGPGGSADTVRELASLQDGRVVLGWKGRLPQPVLDGYTATYLEIAPGVDLILTATRTGFEQFFRLNTRPPAGTAPTFRLPLTGEGLTVAENAQGGLDVADAATGKTVGRAPAPRMWGEAEDAKSGEPARAAHVAMKVAKSPAGTEVVLEPDPAFLADPSVSYPLLVDPSITVYPNSDTLIQNDLSSNQNGGTELKAGSYNSGTTKARSLVKINVAAISALDNSHVLSADFLAYNFYSSTCTATPVGLHRITETWSPTSVTWSNGAPSMILTPFVSVTESNGYNANCPEGYIHFNNTAMRDLVQQWIDGAPNYGFAIRAGSENSSTSWKRFHSADYGGARVPRLTVTYAFPPDAPTITSVTPGNASANVYWSAPADNGESINSYTVTPYIGSTAQTSLTVSGASLSTNVPGLTNGTAYTFKVRATNDAGAGAYSASSAAVTPRTVPAQPTGVTATVGETSGTAKVTWTAPANGGSAITNYTITPYAGGVPATAVTVPASPTEKTISGLTNGTAYTFKVKATNAAGTGLDSALSNAVTPRTVPVAPDQPTVIAGNGSAQVSWTAPNNGGSAITGYTITPYIGTTAGAEVPATTSPKEITGLTNGAAYTFTVTATNSIGTSGVSIASAPVTPRTVPGAPTGVSATGWNGFATLTWTPPASDGGAAITGYTITTSPGGATTQAPAGANGATITGLTNGAAYTFTVFASNAAGAGEASAPSAAVTPTTTPGAPTAVNATSGDGHLDVTWAPPSSDGGTAVTGYTVWVDPGAISVPAAADATSATITGLINGTQYTLTVTATNSAGTGVESDAVVATPATMPGAPDQINAIAGNAEVTLTWAAPATDGGMPITRYTITRNPGAATINIDGQAGAPPATSATLTGLTNGSPYTFTITATNAIGTGDPSTATSPVAPRTVPGAPSDVTVTPVNGAAMVTWTPPTSDGGAPLTGYTVTANPGGAAVAAPADATGATVPGLTNGTAYTFTVAATNPAGTGPGTTSAPATPGNAPDAPANVAALAGNGQAVITWEPPSDGGSAITGYTIIRSPGEVTTTAPATAMSAFISGLTNGTAYTFTVTATNDRGSSPAAPSGAVTPHVPDSAECAGASKIWTGEARDGTWATATNWSPPGAPNYGTVCLPAGSTANLTGGATVTALTVQPGAYLRISGTPLSIAAGGSMTNRGHIDLAGGWNQACGANATNDGAIRIVANGSITNEYGYSCITRGLLANSGTIANWASTYTVDTDLQLDNDGTITARAGHLFWTGAGSAPASSGTFTGQGGALEIAGVTVDDATTFGNGVTVNGTLYGAGHIPAGVTVNVTGGWIFAPLSGPGLLRVTGGHIVGDVAGNLRIPTGANVEMASFGPISLRPGSDVQVDTSALTVRFALSNQGTMRFTGSHGLSLNCGADFTNNGSLRVEASADVPASSRYFTGGYGYGCDFSDFRNGPDGTFESWAPNLVLDWNFQTENDGAVIARAGTVLWQGWNALGSSSGRFAGEGGLLQIDSVTVDHDTTFGNGVTIVGSIAGEGSIPAGVTVDVAGGSLNAPLAGPGLLRVTASANFHGEIDGNLRLEPAATVWLHGTTEAPLTIRNGAHVDVSSTTAVAVNGPMTNNGLIEINNSSGFQTQCGAPITNNGNLQVHGTNGAVGIALVKNTIWGCIGTDTPRLMNGSGGIIESDAAVAPTIQVPFENDGTVIAGGNARWSLSATAPTVIHSGYFGSEDAGHLVLCGLFLTEQPSQVAEDVGLANGCGTMVVDVTDFTPQQIDDVVGIRSAATTLAGQTAPDLPGCTFRGINLTEFFDSYPAEACNASFLPGSDADKTEFFISWMPGLGAAVDLGHAIFGKDLAGRDLSNDEQVLAGLFVIVPGTLDDELMTGGQRIVSRAGEILTYPVKRSRAQRSLKGNLGASEFGTNGQAHHLFGFKDHNTPLGQRLRDDLGIDLNGVDNGIWLPYKDVDLPTNFVGSFHRGASANYYTSFVNQYLDVHDANLALDRLDDIKIWLSNGCMPINAAGVRVKPAKGTCPADLVSHYRSYGIDIEAAV